MSIERTSGYCSNPPCGVGPVDLFAGQCRACYQYRYRTGKPRPADVVRRSSPRVIERLLWKRAQGAA